MKCKIVDCVNHDDCGILEITQKQPKNANSCSYYKDQKHVDKQAKKQAKFEEEVKKKKLRKNIPS